jgi:hypothetical protein
MGRPQVRRSLVVALTLATGLWASSFASARHASGDTLPSRLTDEAFWTLITSFSERPGSFPSDNLLSNERSLQDVVVELVQRTTPDGVYLGVGPEQNFTYIAALKPKMAFIVDIRRGNLDLHLMYKALFELSADRAEFVSRLFSRRRPAGLRSSSSAAEIFDAYATAETNESLYIENLRAVVNQLAKTHGFALGADDTLRLQRTHRAFYTHGPGIQYSSTRNVGRRDEPTYRDLMLATAQDGLARSYLASEEAFAVVKDLETRNLIVPIIGNFAGARAIRAVAEYLAERRATVSAFYLSNVEEYLRRDGAWKAFCGNAAGLPVDDHSTIVRSVRGDTPEAGFRLTSELGAMSQEFGECDRQP